MQKTFSRVISIQSRARNNSSKIALSIISLTACCALLIGQKASAVAHDSHEFKLQPRVNVWGITGSSTIGRGQIAVPFYGDQNKVLLGLVEGSIAAHDGVWYAGMGLAYRHVITDRIYGGYLIADYNRSLRSSGFLVINPGLEMLGENWDFNANAYIPLHNTKQRYTTVKWGEEFGINDYVQHVGHSGYDRYMQRQDFEVALRGVDFKVGRRIPLPYFNFDKAKIYLVGYYFSAPSVGEVRGVSAKLTYEINEYASVELTHTYDNYNHHRTLLGMRVALGGYGKEEQREFGIKSRLLDPVERDGYGATIVPIRQVVGRPEVIDAKPRLRYDNLWFISANGAPRSDGVVISNSNGVHNDVPLQQGDGTYEHPFTSFSPATLNHIAAYSNTGNVGVITKYPMLYFAPGVYSLAKFSGVGGLEYKLQLPTGWGIYGRNVDYTRRANGGERPTLIGGIDLAPSENEVDGGNNRLDSIVLRETGDSTGRGEGMLSIFNARNIELDNVKIGADSFAAGGYYAGMYIENSSVSLHDVDIRGYNDNAHETFACGICASNSIINFAGGVNNVSAINSRDEQSAVGISVVDHSIVNFQDGISNIDATSFAQGSHFSPAAYAIFADQVSTINFNGGTTNAIAADYASGVSPKAMVFGLFADNGSSINFHGGTNTVVGRAEIPQGSTGEYFMVDAVAAEVDDNSVINFYGGRNTLSAMSLSNGVFATAASIGMVINNSSMLNFAGGINTVNVSSWSRGTRPRADSLGMLVQNESVINFQNGDNAINSKAEFITVSDEAARASSKELEITPSTINDDDYGARARGVEAYNEATINFTGGINRISSRSCGDRSKTTQAMFYESFGITAYGANVNFTGGRNEISAISVVSDGAVAASAKAYGIAAYVANINFTNAAAGGNNTINVGVVDAGGGEGSRVGIDSTVYGFFADADSSLAVDGVEIKPEYLDSVSRFIAIAHLPGQYTHTGKIVWEGKKIIPW